MAIITYDQFEEIVAEALDKHVSRDTSLDATDFKYETGNVVEAIAVQLRLHGLLVPRKESPTPGQDR